MRAGVCCALALTLLAVSGALRPAQAEGTTRIGRRLPTSSTEESVALEAEDASTPRPRGTRRREEAPRQVIRSRTRTRPPPTEDVTEPETKRNKTNESFDSRRTYSRTRNRPEAEEDTPKANVIRSRSRYNRPAPTQSTPTTKTPEVNSPNINENKLEVINSTLDEIPRVVFKEYEPITQFDRRSTTTEISENFTPRRRSRVNVRTSERSDLASSGTTNSISISEKGPTTDKMIDLRNSRKLRYKSRLSETDTNLTGLGITASNEVKKSSQKESLPSQETKLPVPTAENVHQSTETNNLKTTTLKVMRIVRRPVQRGKGGFKPSVPESLPKKRSDEVTDDDNYPEPFKALLHAKNTTTHVTSTNDEILTVKASQKVYDSFAPSRQSTLTSPSRNKYSRLRPQPNVKEEKNNEKKQEDEPTESTIPAKVSSTKQPDYKFRSQYTTRSRKFSSYTSTTTVSNTAEQVTDKPAYKYNRKFKVSTTEASKADNKVNFKRVETNNLLKRTLHRPTLYAKRNVSNGDNGTSTPSNEENLNIGSALESIAKHKASLPRTSYYTRQRNSNKVVPSSTPSTEEPIKDNNNVSNNFIETADRKNADNVDIPLIFTLLKPADVSQNENILDATQNENQSEKPHKMFVIAVTSKESQETSTENEMTSNTVEETDVKPAVVISSTPKYHATYTIPQKTVKIAEHDTLSAVPPLKNIPTRKSGRVRGYTRNQHDGVSDEPPTRDRGAGKYTDSYTKTTEASTNGINLDAEKSRHRFSSKYRASHLDKPIYRATVPTVTPSTAWLKFFVTDRLLTKFVEEPNWFEEDYNDVTTPMSRLNITPPITYESSIELIEGEEFQLGPDMNAISFTQTRSPAELMKLSESLVKPTHVMNVEASQHSQSVTVSIFDALAEILTSTPRNRLSSTTEVQKQNIKTDSLQSLNVVSNNINVNSEVLPSQDTSLNVNVNTNVQNTGTTLNVNNPSVAAGVTTTPTSPQSLPTPIPTTPVSARKPFAFKVLYSEPTDKLSTARELTSNQPSTDSPTMVYNTVSDLLLSNNNVVSSELTSMLSSNINNILRNMDDKTKSKVSADMKKILKSLIPRAIDGLDDNVDFTPNTTPYSLEEIKDTENVNFGDDSNVNSGSESFDRLQNAGSTSNVNITNGFANTDNGVAQSDSANDQNSVDRTQLTSILPESNLRTTSANLNTLTTTPTTPVTLSVSVNTNLATSFVTANSDSIVVESGINSNVAPNNPNVPFPFLTNFQIDDFVTKDSGNFNNNPTDSQNKPIPFSSVAVTSLENDDDSNIQDINDVTPLQLWILSKKARVLKMIEDLIRDHNNELANATALTEMFRQSDNFPISERLTEIMNTMNSTTKSTDSDDSSITTPSSFPTPLTSQPSNESFEDRLTTSATSSKVATSNESFTTVSSRLGDIIASTPSTSSNAETATAMSTTEATVELSNNSLNDATTTKSIEETSTQSLETVTPTDITTTTQANQETTTQNDSETTTEVDIETTTNTNGQADSALSSGNNNNNNKQSTIPKKDYVIFGILPNNTVIRKNPNDDILETLTEASPYIVYGLLPNNTVIRKFPNGTRVPRVMQKIDILPISPWTLRNPYSPIHNNPAIVRPQSNPIRVSTNVETSTSNNGTDRLTTIDTVNNQQNMISTSALNLKDSSSGVTTAAYKPAEQSTASHVLSLRTTTMLPSVDEILLNSISSAAKEEMVISSMTSSTRQPTILTLDIDPETKQIRTEKPGDGGAVFKFIPIDDVTTTSPKSNVLKLASSKSPTSTVTSQIETITESNTQTPQIPTQVQNGDQTTTVQVTAGTITDAITESTTAQSMLTTSTTETSAIPTVSIEPVASTTVAPVTTTTEITTTTTPIPIETTTEARITLTTTTAASTTAAETLPPSTVSTVPEDVVTKEDSKRYQEDAALLEAIFSGTERLPKKINFKYLDQNTATPTVNTQTTPTTQSDDDKFLQQLFSAAAKNPHTLTIPNIGGDVKVTGVQTTTVRSIEDDIRQFEEDTKLLKALLAATGQNPDKFNIPTLDIRTTTIVPTTETITTSKPTVTTRVQTTTSSINRDTTRFEEDAKFLQALLQATGQNNGNFNIPDISGITSNVRIASNPRTTSLGSSPTTPINIRPIYTTLRTTTSPPSTATVPTTFQPRVTDPTTARISTTFPPINRRKPAIILSTGPTTAPTARRMPIRFSVTTEIPTSSTFSVEEDLAFLNNLKSVLNTNTNNADPEAALANRIIALAVDRSLNEIKTGKGTERAGKNLVPTTPPTTTTTTTTSTTTTTTPRPTTTTPPSTPSIEEDLKQFQEDTKLLQALLKATGQDPSKFNLPTLPNINTNVSPKIPPGIHNELNLLSNLLASPSPLNEPFDPLTQKPKEQIKTVPTTPKPYGAKIAVKDDVKNAQDDGKLLQTLIQLQGVQETTTQKSKIAITGQSTDEALKKLIQQTQATGMMQEATKMPIAISTEYGKSNDALLAALLKEQGFGPTTASSLDEQLRLAALLNQVVVTPKARRTTTAPPPPPPPAPRRPILDGLAWLWQQWRETSPGPGPSRPNRRPDPSPTASVSASQATSNRVNWFGSGPFVGNADDRPSSNRIPLEPPRAVTSEQTPGRGQLVSAAINVTRAFSQFLGAAIQGAAQTVQSVIRAGQRAATDVYSNGSGASG